MRVVSPCFIDGHTGLPELEVRRGGNSLAEFLLDAGVCTAHTDIFGWNRFRNELFGSNEVRGEADPVVYQGCSLQFVDQIEKALPIVLFLMVEPVEPDHFYVSVSRKQFRELKTHIVQVRRPLWALRLAVP